MKGKKSRKETHVLELLGPAVEPAAGKLALAQPPAKRVCVDEVEAVEHGKGADAGPHCVRRGER